MKNILLKALSSGLVFIATMCTHNVSASLTNVDLSVLNDNQLVFDSENNKEWLRWDVANNTSLDDLLVTYTGFSLATTDELHELYKQAFEGDIFSTNRNETVSALEGTQLRSNINNFHSLFGTTGGDLSYGVLKVNGVWGTYGVRGHWAHGSLYMNNAYTATGEANSLLSYILVRDSAATINVPEPTTLAMFALGIMGLVSRRTKREV